MAVSKTESIEESPAIRAAKLPQRPRRHTRPVLTMDAVDEDQIDTVRHFNISVALEQITQLAMRAESFATATERELQAMPWTKEDDDGERGLYRERLGHLFGATADAVFATVQACRQAATELQKGLASFPGSR